ncbi:MAG: FAD-dependent oxidoreductase [Agathobaculum desmolans]|uniref:FAD-dependent oxidoreductase n=1 Tax=Agathobaculum desmolans TaxID=39484 RepID=UPI0039913AFA
MVSRAKNVDDAWADARAFLKNHASEVLAAMREIPGFESANFVYDSSGYPVVGDVLYIRETVHMAIKSTYSGSNAENANYQVGTLEALRAGTGSGNGSDTANYFHRIGLAHYGADIHPYSPADCKNSSGDWIWNYDGNRKMRPDLNIQDNAPANPVYLPYEALITTYVSNLLLPGYAANVSSFASGEIRVLPNLCVLGDAAGIAAGYCANNGYLPRYLSDAQIREVQNLLESVNAKIDK